MIRSTRKISLYYEHCTTLNALQLLLLSLLLLLLLLRFTSLFAPTALYVDMYGITQQRSICKCPLLLLLQLLLLLVVGTAAVIVS
jgi:hypothetical protein